MRFGLAALLLALSLAAEAETWRFAVIGDTPYSDQERRELPRMLEAIAEAGTEVVAHIGDIKSGRDRCDDKLFADRKAVFEASRIPFVYVPGDNEWTDCQRVTNGGYDPIERLEKLRQLFWSGNESLGQRRIRLERQPGDYPEHSRFRLGPVLFITLNVPGDDNDWGKTESPKAEFLARNPAVLAWLKDGFALARRDKLAGIVVLLQANPAFRHFNQGLPHHGFRQFLHTLRDEALDFPGQVLLVHGDTHHHQIDQPLRDAGGNIIANFTRLESYGYPFMGWAQVIIDTDSPALFRFYSHPWP